MVIRKKSFEERVFLINTPFLFLRKKRPIST